MTYLDNVNKHGKHAEDNLIRAMCPGDFMPGAPKGGFAACSSNCGECWHQEIPEKKEYESPSVATSFEKAGEEANNMSRAVEALNQHVPKILDSGERRKFETGAVRDIQEGKGRCDLMPLDVVADVMGLSTLEYISCFVGSGETRHLERLLEAIPQDGIFCDGPTMFLEVAKHFEEGAKKYGENNWQKGIPVHCYIDSAVRHYLKFLRGDKDEPHDRAFCWNIMCAIWTCKHKPELNEYRKEELCEKDISKPSHSRYYDDFYKVSQP